MRRGIQVRLIAFVLLSVLGMGYVGASYLGFVDSVLGRGYTVHVTLPDSGGLFEGSEATYRGVKIGKVTKMSVDADGLRVDLRLKDDAKVPASSPVFVHNLSAVGEQYLSFEPTSRSGPMLKDGDTVRGTKDSLPVGEDVLLTDLSRFVSSLDGPELGDVIHELGTMFRDNAQPLRTMVDSATKFIDEARAHEPETISLINTAGTVLRTQQDNAANIQSFSEDLAALTGTLATSDADLRKVLAQAGPAADELVIVVKTLRRQLPTLLGTLTNIAKVLDSRLPALEQLLVTLPRLVAAGPTAQTQGKQHFGRVHLNLNMVPNPCTDGYLPPSQWRPTSEMRSGVSAPLSSDHSFEPYYPAQCKTGPPTNMRGMKYAPAPVDWRDEYKKAIE
ncbi:MCE family protein [Aeromicrobium terrae]|uniref:MCE family protein n=1 Tax=Aeromicrobium terrae TaxID=2498846 RepID=A0A5C8NJ04_9ACTN|nr:MlaD family protein [Aeromicrobium terrae]TXL60761.1 MCE family protein [Aeromicrobium terrae]